MFLALRVSSLQHSHHTASVLLTSAEGKQKAILSRTFATLHVQNSLRPPAGSGSRIVSTTDADKCKGATEGSNIGHLSAYA